jgi:hypothetical protein
MADRQEWLLAEAERWHREGRVDDHFLAYVRSQYVAGKSEAGFLKVFFYILGGLLLFLGIFFLVSQFWDVLTDRAKSTLLLIFAAVSYSLGALFESTRKTRAVAAIGLSLGGGLAIFGLSYLRIDGPGVHPQEGIALILSFLLAIGHLAYGYWRQPAVAGVGAGVLFLSFLLWGAMGDYEESANQVLISAMFGAVLVHAVFNLGLWARAMAWAANRNAIRVAGTVNAVLLIPATIAFVENVLNPPNDWPGIIALGLVAAALSVSGVLWRYMELVIVGGFAAIGDALWVGFSKGEFVGTVIALVVVAVALIGLAQSGLLVKWLAPEKTSPPLPPTMKPPR